MDKLKVKKIFNSTVGGKRDTTAPTVTLSSAVPALTAAAFDITATLSEISTDFTDSSLTLTNCSVSIAGSGTSYTITVTPTADGTASVLVKIGGFHDAAGNANTVASNTISTIYLSTLNVWVKSDTGLYKDAAKTQPATADGDAVYTWDNIAAGNDFVQATLGNRFLLKIVSGAHYLRSDGSDDAMKVTISADASQTIMCIVKKVSAIGTSAKTFLSVGSINNSQVFTQSTSGTGFNYFGNEAAGVVVGNGTPTNLSIVSLVFVSTSSAKLRIDANTAIAFDPQNDFSTGTNICIGARDVGSGQNNGDYDFLEVIQCTSALSDPVQENVRAYLATRVANPS